MQRHRRRDDAIAYVNAHFLLAADDDGNPEEKVQCIGRRSKLRDGLLCYEYQVLYLDGANEGSLMFESEATMASATLLPPEAVEDAARASDRLSSRAHRTDYARLAGHKNVEKHPHTAGAAVAAGKKKKKKKEGRRGGGGVRVRIPIGVLPHHVADAISPFHSLRRSPLPTEDDEDDDGDSAEVTEDEVEISESIERRRQRWAALSALSVEEVFDIDHRTHLTADHVKLLALQRALALGSVLRTHAGAAESSGLADFLDAAAAHAVHVSGLEGAVATPVENAAAVAALLLGEERAGSARAVTRVAHAFAPAWAALLSLARLNAQPLPLPRVDSPVSAENVDSALARLRTATCVALELGDAISAWQTSFGSLRSELRTALRNAEDEAAACCAKEARGVAVLSAIPNLALLSSEAAALIGLTKEDEAAIVPVVGDDAKEKEAEKETETEMEKESSSVPTLRTMASVGGVIDRVAPLCEWVDEMLHISSTSPAVAARSVLFARDAEEPASSATTVRAASEGARVDVDATGTPDSAALACLNSLHASLLCYAASGRSCAEESTPTELKPRVPLAIAVTAASSAVQLWRRLCLRAAARDALPPALEEVLIRIEEQCVELRARVAPPASGAAERESRDTTSCFHSRQVLRHVTPMDHVESKTRVERCMRALVTTQSADPAGLRLMWPSGAARGRDGKATLRATDSRFEPAPSCSKEAPSSTLEIVELDSNGSRSASSARSAFLSDEFKKECMEIAISVVHSGAHLRELEVRAAASRARDAPVAMPAQSKTHRRQPAADTFVSSTSVVAARAAGRVCCHAVDAVLSGASRNAFCLIRPPGHHCGRCGFTEGVTSLGFCLVNNVCIAIAYARLAWGIDRVAVVDFDAHFGNGTASILEGDDSSFYASVHLENIFPATADCDATCTENFVSIPIQAEGLSGEVADEEGQLEGRAGFRRAMASVILPALRRFDPEIVLLSAGFDAHRADPLGGEMGLLEEDFVWCTRAVLLAASAPDGACAGRVISCLEGGYDVTSTNALATCVAAHVHALRTKPVPASEVVPVAV